MGINSKKKILNIKTLFNKEIKNMIPTEIEKRFESIEKEDLKEEIYKQKEEKEGLKEEINKQKEKDDLK